MLRCLAVSSSIGNAEHDSKRQVVEIDGNIDSAEKEISKFGEHLEVHQSEIIHQLSQLQARNEELLPDRCHVDQQLDDEKALRDQSMKSYLILQLEQRMLEQRTRRKKN